jgi:predicted membrane protein
MLACCLVLGCSISSFAHRRREQDKFQTPIFVLAITVASILGLGFGINTNLIMLGLIPWALCFAMVLSCSLHWLVRRYSGHSRVYEIDEKDCFWRGLEWGAVCVPGCGIRLSQSFSLVYPSLPHSRKQH